MNRTTRTTVRTIQANREASGWRLARLATIALLATLTLLPLVAVSSTRAAADDPETVVRAWVAGITRGETEAVIALYADDAVIIALGREYQGKAVIAARQRTIIGPVLRPSLTIERITVDGQTATAELVGENAITRFDQHGPLRNRVTFVVRDGKIQREIGPMLEPADLAWYAEAAPRFWQGRGGVPALPRTGGGGSSALPYALAQFGVGGLVLLGMVLVRHGATARERVPIERSGGGSHRRGG